MRMMKNNNNEIVMVIGIDHGYGNMKTATRCFPSGVARYDKEPIFQNNLLVYNGMYYQIGEEHKEFCAEKTQDEDYYVLTLAAIARELEIFLEIFFLRKGTGWERNEPGKGTHCSRTSPYLGSYTERRFPEISSPE